MRVLELSDAEAAAGFAGKLFVRWGSEVIRVESPDRAAPVEAEETYLHGGKRRVILDYRTPEDRTALDALAGTCDVLLTDASVADIEAFGLLDLGAGRSSLVRVAVTPFGLTGPYSAFPATEATLLALAGLTYLTGDPGRAPLTIPGHYAAYQAGTVAYTAALAALLHARRNPGTGPRVVDLSILEVLVGLHQMTDTRWLVNDEVRMRVGNRSSASTGGMLPCRDGWFGFSTAGENWMALALMLGRPDLVEDPRFSTNSGRLENRDEFDALVQAALSGRTRHEIFTEAQETWRLAMGYGASLADCLADRHLEAREFWRPLEGATESLRMPGSPFRFRGEAQPPERSAVPAGTDTVAVLSELDLTTTAEPSMPSSAPAPSPARPLEGVRVLDLTRVWAGPLAARVIADLGADVICIEGPTGRGPAKVPPNTPTYFEGGQLSEPWNQQPLFHKLHRNRRSVGIDLKKPEGRALFLELVAQSDVVIENFSARAMGGLDLGYERLREANPGIIYVGMPAFGADGPYRDYVGYGPAVEPMTGLPAVMGYGPDEVRVTGTATPDAIAGLAAASAVLTALERRERTGEGACIDVSQHEAGIALLGEYFIEYQRSGETPAYVGNGHARFAPHGIYRCAGDDDWIALAARDEAEWCALCDVAGASWASDPRFATNEARLAHRAELDAAIEGWTRDLGKFEVMERLMTAGVPAGAVLNCPEYLGDPHLAHRGYYARLEHPATGVQQYDGSPFVFNGERGYDEWLPSPLLGEHNESVLRELLSKSSAEIADLQEAGALVDRPPG